MSKEIVFVCCFGCFHDGDECRECNVREACKRQTMNKEVIIKPKYKKIKNAFANEDCYYAECPFCGKINEVLMPDYTIIEGNTCKHFINFDGEFHFEEGGYE